MNEKDFYEEVIFNKINKYYFNLSGEFKINIKNK